MVGGRPATCRYSDDMRILIVEDDADTSRFVARGLSELGHHVVTSPDGRDGLFLATEGGFDALVIDRMLPGLDGLSLVKALRAAGTMQHGAMRSSTSRRGAESSSPPRSTAVSMLGMVQRPKRA